MRKNSGVNRNRTSKVYKAYNVFKIAGKFGFKCLVSMLTTFETKFPNNFICIYSCIYIWSFVFYQPTISTCPISRCTIIVVDTLFFQGTQRFLFYPYWMRYIGKHLIQHKQEIYNRSYKFVIYVLIQHKLSFFRKKLFFT